LDEIPGTQAIMINPAAASSALAVLAVPDQLHSLSGRDSLEKGANQPAAEVENLQRGGQGGVFQAKADGGCGIEGIGVILFQLVNHNRSRIVFHGSGLESGKLVDVAEVAVSGHVPRAHPPKVGAPWLQAGNMLAGGGKVGQVNFRIHEPKALRNLERVTICQRHGSPGKIEFQGQVFRLMYRICKHWWVRQFGDVAGGEAEVETEGPGSLPPDVPDM